MTELIQCSKCGQDFEATHDDLGTYWHDTCHKLSLKASSFEELEVMMQEIYVNIKSKKERLKDNYE
jgi:hypothetical protein